MSHQKEGFDYALRTKDPALFWEMRVGKTLPTIRRLLVQVPIGNQLRVLIAAPNSALRGWEEELEKEDESDRIRLQGRPEQRLELLKQGHKWNLINKEGFSALPEIGYKPYVWDAVVLDESHFIKNPKAKVTKFFLTHFDDTRCAHRWVLSGTPFVQTKLDLFCQMAFLDGGAFGFRNFWSFRALGCSRFGYQWFMKPRVSERFEETLRDRCSVVRRKDVGVEPNTAHQVRELTLPDSVRKLYDKAEADFELAGETTIWAVCLYQWLRQLSNGMMKDKLLWDGKIKELVYLLENELGNERCVVWFVYNEDIRYCKEKMSELKRQIFDVTGEISDQRKRDMAIDLWSNSRNGILLLQVKLAQSGVDLSRSDTAIYFSLPTSVTEYKQSRDRIVSPLKQTSLSYIYLVTKDTVDDDVYNALRIKQLEESMVINRVLFELIRRRRAG